MKTKLLTLIVIALPFFSHAKAPVKALDSSARAEKVKQQIENKVLAISGVNGIGITGCNPKTGAADLEHNFVHCISIYADNEQTQELLESRFPVGTKVKDVFVTIEYMGPVEAQPRMSGGN